MHDSDRIAKLGHPTVRALLALRRCRPSASVKEAIRAIEEIAAVLDVRPGRETARQRESVSRLMEETED